jgi:GT2 family glycosyltransferase
MSIAIIIPNLHSSVIDKVITAVLAQATKDLEVWVVGQDGYGKVPMHPQVHTLVTPEPIFPGAARNLGAQQVAADAYIFLDADCIPQPGWLSALLAAWMAYPDAGAISGAMLPQSDTFIQHCGQIACFHEYLIFHPPGERATLASFSLLVPRQAWLQSGGFDPNLRHTEDIEFTLRLRLQGWRLFFEPRAQVYHCPPRLNWRDFWRYARQGGAYSIQTRLRYTHIYVIPGWLRSPRAWQLLAPAIAILRTCQIYLSTPGLERYLYALPWVFIHKLAWCYGAADGLQKIKKNSNESSSRNCNFSLQ